MLFIMQDLPSAIVLSEEQVRELAAKLAEVRHNINNHLALVVASVELLQRRPEMSDRIKATLVEQPGKITEELRKFAVEFEKALSATPR